MTSNETTLGDVTWVGGHFNLILTEPDITALGLTTAQSQNLYGVLGTGSEDSSGTAFYGAGNGARRGTSVGYLHSQGVFGGPIKFHLDLGNPYPDIVGTLGHWFHDGWPGHWPFTKCLDNPTGGSSAQ
ncbi:MAG: hypothetical protein ABSH40_22570 [Bryobacteraceae bacterium]